MPTHDELEVRAYGLFLALGAAALTGLLLLAVAIS